MEERELVTAAQHGDDRAFATLVRPHLDMSFRVAYVVTRDAADAEDATQEALVKAWRALGRFRAGEPFRPWLLQIVANEARNRRRSAGRQLRLTLRTPVPTATERPEGLLEALAALPDDAQTVLAYRYLLGLTEQETALALGIAQGTVKSRTARALDRLREAYD